jgi:hypothetical protein
MLLKRNQEKVAAVEAIEQALSHIERAGRQPDRWECTSILNSVGALSRYNYFFAEVAARHAMVPIRERSAEFEIPSDELLDACNLAILKQAFCEARELPVQLYPHFGPIIFAGSEQSRGAAPN